MSDDSSMCNVRQTRRLLTRLATLGTELYALTIAELGWEFFRWADGDCESMEGAVRNLEALKLWISLNGVYHDERSDITLLERNLPRFLSCSPDLETLGILIYHPSHVQH